MAFQVLELSKFLYVVVVVVDKDGVFFYKRLHLKQNTVANAQFLVRVPLLLSHLALVEEIQLANV